MVLVGGKGHEEPFPRQVDVEQPAHRLQFVVVHGVAQEDGVGTSLLALLLSLLEGLICRVTRLSKSSRLRTASKGHR